jgi:mono/diheme cytochrome c family protein
VRAAPIFVGLLSLLAVGARDGCGNAHESELSGREMFLRFCSPCHGEDAKGDGPVALFLRPRPPDLTTLARTGRFDEDRLAAVIDGREVVQPHGTRQMPVWGTIFEEQLLGREDRAGEGRAMTKELVAYLRTIQETSETR